MTSQPGKQTIAIHTFPCIERSKCNQATKFGQLIEYNIKNIFLDNSSTKCGREAFPGPLLKNQNWGYLWISSLNFCSVYFIASSSRWIPKYVESMMLIACFHLL